MAGTRITPPGNAHNTQQFNARIRELWREMTAREVLEGRLVDATVTSASNVLVTHKLGRKYQGAIVCGQSGTVAAYVANPATTDAATGGDSSTNVYVQFASSTTQGFTLWVF